jgi:hypothetical protein
MFTRIAGSALAVFASALLMSTANAAVKTVRHGDVVCTPTGYIKDGIDLTAAYMGGTHSGETLDGTGCNVVVYYGPGTSGSVDSNTEVHGANYFGVLINGGQNVTVQGSRIHDIGEVPFNGAQHGVGIYSAVSELATHLVIKANRIWNYQKGGIVVLGANNTGAAITNNDVEGFGPIDFIAQNGIEYGLGANNLVVKLNTVNGHSYTGAGGASSGGILGLGGACFGGLPQHNNDVENNIGVGNDVGDYDLNLDDTCGTAEPGASQNVISSNHLRNDYITNTSGNGSGPYQAGISIADSKAKLAKNDICGDGYTSAPPPGGFIAQIDSTGSVNLREKGNSCKNPAMPAGPGTSSARENNRKIAKTVRPYF